MDESKRYSAVLVSALLLILLTVSSVAIYTIPGNENTEGINRSVNVGVAFCGNTTQEAKLLIDRAKNYTNLFIFNVAGGELSHNQTNVEEICDYAVSQGLKIIVNIGNIYSNTWFWQLESIEPVKHRWVDRWGDKFLGMYYSDEPGGIQLDGNWTDWFDRHSSELTKIGHPLTDSLYTVYTKIQAYKENGTLPLDYEAEAEFFTEHIIKGDRGNSALKAAGIKTFTSDYALHWFDYLGGYDVLFTEVGWNCSLEQQISLVKGAARLQDKEWGAIITWKYRDAPYLDSGEQIYNQMTKAYQAGADYIVVFNYPKLDGNDFGVMKDEHFYALEMFWNDVTSRRLVDLSEPEAVMVLPRNYGWGMRRPDDIIWGFWDADGKSPIVGTTMSKLLIKYGVRLDIVYEDQNFPVSSIGYQKIYYWNSTDIS